MTSMVIRDALLHYVHFILIFTLASMLVCEVALFGRSMSRPAFDRLRIIDRWYGIAAGLVVLSGILLLTLGLKPAPFFTHNPVFWTKMTLFVCVALLSIPLTVRLIRTEAAAGSQGAIVFDDEEFQRLRRLLWAQIALFAFIPLCAALMANGI
jgi:putative membrane protein